MSSAVETVATPTSSAECVGNPRRSKEPETFEEPKTDSHLLELIRVIRGRAEQYKRLMALDPADYKRLKELDSVLDGHPTLERGERSRLVRELRRVGVVK